MIETLHSTIFGCFRPFGDFVCSSRCQLFMKFSGPGRPKSNLISLSMCAIQKYKVAPQRGVEFQSH